MTGLENTNRPTLFIVRRGTLAWELFAVQANLRVRCLVSLGLYQPRRPVVLIARSSEDDDGTVITQSVGTELLEVHLPNP